MVRSIAPEKGRRLRAALLFGGPHLDELAAARDEGFELAGLGRRQGAGRDVADLAEVGGQGPVGLGQFPLGLGELAPWRAFTTASGVEGDGRQPLVAAGGFHDDELRLQLRELPDQVRDALVVLGHAPRGARGADGYVQPVLGDIDPDEHVLTSRRHRFLRSPFLVDTGSYGPGNCAGSMMESAGRPRSYGLGTRGESASLQGRTD